LPTVSPRISRSANRNGAPHMPKSATRLRWSALRGFFVSSRYLDTDARR
jgi:hypothetical protein